MQKTPTEDREHRSPEEEDEEESWREPFSLLRAVVGARPAEPGAARADAVEVIRYSGVEILDLLRAGPGETIRLCDGITLLRVARAGSSARLRLRPGMTGTVIKGGATRAIAPARRRTITVRLRAATDCAQICDRNARYLVRFIRAPTLPKRKLRLQLGRGSLVAVAASVAAHLVVLSSLVQGASSTAAVDQDRPSVRVPAASILLDDLRPVPKPALGPAITDEAAPRVRRAAASPSARRGSERRSLRRSSATAAASGLLAVLQRAPSLGTERSDLGALAGNLSAIRSRATGVELRISGPIGRGGVGVQVGGGSGEESTRRGLGRLGKGGAGQLGVGPSSGRRKPLAMVPAQPTIRPLPRAGRLDRAAIQQVISQHLHEVQSCYERALLRQSSLTGKLVLDWTIELDGAVSQARLVTPGLGEVGSCVLRALRGWRFPRPEGGTVPVRYPFIFRVQGF